ncbi:MAG TPA: peptidyl-prolyl cis-trans isomerase [Ignavibacteriaceae bacterium]|nr:peptidyl-prolyl cis-trans isomerase [Ignavibacteriaceae bacterium]
MRISKFPVLLLVFLMIIIWEDCKSEKSTGINPQNNVVAKYGGGHVVTINELNKYVVDYLYLKKFPIRSQAYNNALTDLLMNQFKRMDFFDKGLDKDSSLIDSISRTINEELVYEYFNKKYLDKYANEEYAKKFYGIMGKQVVYQLIELSIPENAAQKQLDSLKQKALAIKSEVDNGKDFSSLVKEYSQNKISLMNNGYMPPVDWKQSLLNRTGEIIFQLNKNDVSVLKTDNSFMIIKIAGINEVPVQPFDSIKSQTISDLKSIYLNKSLEEFEKDKKELIDESNLRWNESALKQIVQWSRIPNFYQGKYWETLQNALAKGNNKTILVSNVGKVDDKEFLRLLNNVLILPSSKKGITENDLKNFILEAVRTDIIAKKADSLDLKKNIFNPFTENTVLKYQLVHLYNQAEIEEKIPEATDKALHEFFKENENSLYHQLEKRNLFVMIFSNKEDAEKARAKIKGGTPFEKVTGSYLVETYVKDPSGEIKSFLNDEEPTFGKAGFEMKESQISGPVEFKNENNQLKYAVIKCYHIRPEKQLTFSDVKNSITGDFKNYYREKIEKEIEVELRSRYHPAINEEVLAKIISPPVLQKEE